MSEEATVTLDPDLEDIFTKLDALPLGKAAQLVKAMEDRWGVSAAAPAAMIAGPAVAAEEVEEQTEFDVILKAAGPNKIPVIKIVREVTGLGLKEAKAVVDAAPNPIKEAISKDDAEALVKKLADAGADVELK